MYGYVYQPKSKRSLYGRLAYPPQREFFVGKPGAQSTATAQRRRKGPAATCTPKSTDAGGTGVGRNSFGTNRCDYLTDLQNQSKAATGDKKADIDQRIKKFEQSPGGSDAATWCQAENDCVYTLAKKSMDGQRCCSNKAGTTNLQCETTNPDSCNTGRGCKLKKVKRCPPEPEDPCKTKNEGACLPPCAWDKNERTCATSNAQPADGRRPDGRRPDGRRVSPAPNHCPGIQSVFCAFDVNANGTYTISELGSDVPGNCYDPSQLVDPNCGASGNECTPKDGVDGTARPNSSGGCPAGTKFAGPPNIIKCNKSATNGICQPRFKETAAYTDCPCPVDSDSDTGRCTPQEVDQLKELKNEFMSEAQKHSQVLEGAIRKVRRQPAGFGAGEPWEAANDPGLQQTFCCMNDEKNCLEMCSRNGCPSDVDLRSKAVNLHNAIANDSGVQDTTKIEKNAIAFYTALETKREKQEGSDPVPSPTPQGGPQGRPTPQGRSTPAAPASQAQKGTGPSWIKVVAVLVAVLVTVVIIVLAIDRFTPRKSTLKVQLPSRAALRQRRVARQQRGQKAKGQVAEIMQRHL